MDYDFLQTVSLVVAAVTGGAGAKILEKMLSRREERFDEGNKIRDELRTDITELRKERDEARIEADEWRRRYWTLVEGSRTPIYYIPPTGSLS